jgi:hypothetical protein
MNQTYHILNGDALKDQFPSTINGEKLVARLCLVDGPVEGATVEELFASRAKFIAEHYPEFTEADYFNYVLDTRRIKEIPENSTINLWFEDDLFCQVNFWFILDFINKDRNYTLHLVRPMQHSEYSFGGMNEDELVQAFENKIQITETDQKILKQFWKAYQENDLLELLMLAQDLKDKFPFLTPAIYAHLDRLSEPSRPKTSLTKIMKELNTDKFGLVFQAFCQKEGIYGFGDLQVKRIYNEIMADQEG